jgi:hypothetical protein
MFDVLIPPYTKDGCSNFSVSGEPDADGWVNLQKTQNVENLPRWKEYSGPRIRGVRSGYSFL